jgi:hypothetical protein
MKSIVIAGRPRIFPNGANLSTPAPSKSIPLNDLALQPITLRWSIIAIARFEAANAEPASPSFRSITVPNGGTNGRNRLKKRP